MSIIRPVKPKPGWELIPNHFAEDPSLSEDAVAVGLWLAVKPEGWEVRPSAIQAAFSRRPGKPRGREWWARVESDARERANGTLYHEVEFALPLELSRKQQIEAAREQVRQICGDQHPYSWGLHDKDGNPHVHLEFSGRMLDGIERDADQFFKRYNAKNPERGGCRKESSGDARGPEWVKQVRQDWQDIANRHLAAAGHDARIDHRSNKARGLDEAPAPTSRRAPGLRPRAQASPSLALSHHRNFARNFIYLERKMPCLEHPHSPRK